MKLFDLLDPDLFAQAQAEGHIRRQTHPTEPLAILNYTEKAAHEGVWHAVTLACRGLVYNTDTMEIVARPLAKFFNYGQAGAAHIALDTPVQVTDKADGSLGILYEVPSTGEWAIATRGSFTSEQALHATALYNADYLNFSPVPGWTYLMEIVYPANRIVVDYGPLDALVLLGAVDIVTGWFRGPDEIGLWPGPEVEIFDYPTLAHALAAEPRPNAEGFVVRDLDTGSRVKIKFAEYVYLHRIVTGLNARVVWQHLMDGKPLADLVAPLPDEFHPWVQTVADTLAAAVDQGIAEIDKVYAEILDQMPAGYTRGDFARLAVQHPCRAGLFLKYDGRDPRPDLLKHLKPEPGWTPSGRTYTEETA